MASQLYVRKVDAGGREADPEFQKAVTKVLFSKEKTHFTLGEWGWKLGRLWRGHDFVSAKGFIGLRVTRSAFVEDDKSVDGFTRQERLESEVVPFYYIPRPTAHFLFEPPATGSVLGTKKAVERAEQCILQLLNEVGELEVGGYLEPSSVRSPQWFRKKLLEVAKDPEAQITELRIEGLDHVEGQPSIPFFNPNVDKNEAATTIWLDTTNGVESIELKGGSAHFEKHWLARGAVDTGKTVKMRVVRSKPKKGEPKEQLHVPAANPRLKPRTRRSDTTEKAIERVAEELSKSDFEYVPVTVPEPPPPPKKEI